MKRLWSHLVVIDFCCVILLRAMVLKKDTNEIFKIPTKLMDEADLLEQHGRFMLANMNPAIDPCENFFEYACGNWQNDTMVPILGRNDTLLNTMGKSLDEIIVKFLKNTTVMNEKTAETKAKKLFSSCMNRDEDLSQFYRMISDSFDESILNKGETLDWMALNFYSEYGLTPLLPLRIEHNQSSLMFEISIDQPFQYLTSNSFNFTEISEDFKFDDKRAVEKELEELKSFEKKLIATVTPQNISESQSLVDFLEAHNSESGLDWKRFFDLAFNGTTRDSWIINDKIINFTNLNKFLSNSDKNVMFKYVKWNHIMNFYNNIYFLKSAGSEQNMETECRGIITTYLESAIIPWFIETFFDEERRADALQLSKRLKDTFYSLIDQTTWMDNETKSEAKSKLRAMSLMFGYTDVMRHRSKVDEQFKDVNMTENFWSNLMNLDKNHARDLQKKIGQSFTEIDTETEVANAFYSAQLNEVFMTIGISQLPLYHIKLPISLKFGGIGYVISHEMAHGFDSGCYMYDYDGKKRNWWSPQSLRNFKERYQCLESQYNKFIYEGKQLNGSQTSQDDIADNVGLQIAYQSYLRFLDEDGNLESGMDKPLPGVDFTNKQLFFIKFAQEKCDGQSADQRVEIISSDIHSINEFRTIGPLMNMPEFSEEFNCPLGSNMNPLKKCIIYGSE